MLFVSAQEESVDAVASVSKEIATSLGSRFVRE